MSKYDWKNKEKFLTDLASSKNRCDFLIKNNLTATSGNYNTIRRWLSYHDINMFSEKRKTNIKEIFIEKSLYNRGAVKKIILKNNLIPYKCECCGNEGIWNGNPLILQLEHKNGINNDHRIENLTFLCPNCHSQTPSYAGSNNLKNKFAERLPLLLNYKVIKRENLIEFSKIWNLSIDTIKSWILKNKNQLKAHNIEVHDLNKLLNKKESFISKITHKTNRVNDLKNITEVDMILESLSVKWGIDKHNVRAWIKRNAVEYYNKIEEIRIIKTIDKSIVIPTPKNNFSYRFSQASLLTNKKQVLALSKEWHTSVNGAKKWIRNNMPEKFLEIYDDSLLEKNKKTVHQNTKKEYFQSLNFESFKLNEIMKELDIPKPSLYALIKQHNPMLYAQLMPQISCKYCQGKTRTCGNNKGEIRYRCLSKDCGKSFY